MANEMKKNDQIIRDTIKGSKNAQSNFSLIIESYRNQQDQLGQIGVEQKELLQQLSRLEKQIDETDVAHGLNLVETIHDMRDRGQID